MPKAKCTAENCDKVAKLTKGFCPTHYMRLLRTGTSDLLPKQPKAHLHSKHPMYGGWQQMILRCHDPKNSIFPRYGARGIQVCERWRESFKHFLADMGERPDGMTLDRIDPTGNYEPDNCRWADLKTQRNNISTAGAARMGAAISTSKTAYWQRWRAERGFPADETYKERRSRKKQP